MVASEQHLYQTVVLPITLAAGSIHDYLFTTMTVTEWDQVGHLSKKHLILLEMFEIRFVDAAMSRT